MKNKSFILILAGLISAICLFYLSFTYVSRGIKQDMVNFATEEANKKISLNPKKDFNLEFKKAYNHYKDSLWNEPVYLGYTYAEIKKFELNLGLDLQGGIHITLVVSPTDLIKSISGNNQDPAFVQSLAAAKELHKHSQTSFVDLFYQEWKNKKGEGKLWEAFLTSENQSRISSKSTDAEIISILKSELDDAIGRTMIVLRSRIDKFGATQPIIQAVQSTGRIEIQLPGADDEERIVNQVKAVAELEFLEVWTPAEVSPYYTAINDYLLKTKNLVKNDAEIIEKSEEVVPSAASNELFADTDPVSDVKDSSKTDSASNKVAATDTSNVAKQYPITEYFSISQNGLYARVIDRDKIDELLSNPDVISILPGDMKLMWGMEPKGKDNNGIVPVYFVKKSENAETTLTGDVIVDARQDFDGRGQVAVSMQMNFEGAKEWEKMTKANQGRQIAIALDEVVFSAPMVNEPIPNGSSSISGSFDIQEALDLANILKAGKLPAPTEIERMVVVGPSLGKESIDRGLMSLIVGLIAVVAFMIAYYNKGGLIADLALLFNIFFILGVLSTPSFGTTLTLPGIAGIVLTIGMSIDANVLIFERIREELAEGKNLLTAINLGYNKAFWSIFDSNLTTLITAIILSVFGTGLVKGFAVTLIIGIFCSFFTAVFITRLIIEFMLGKKQDKNISFETTFSKSIFNAKNFNFISKRKIAYAFSSGIIVLGIVAIIIKGGLNFGVSFKGGHQYIVKFDGDVKAHEVESKLKGGFGNDAGVLVKTFDGNDQVQITTSYGEKVTGDNVDEQVKAALLKGLDSYKALNPHVVQSIVVGPTIADDIKTTSLQSILIALVAIFAYVFVRFRKVQFGLGALIALFHDVLVVISIFAILRLVGISFEIDEVFIAAILTIVGYSINDTVVVFDRVRETIGDRELDSSLGSVLNEALNSTLSRTMMTSFTTLLVIIVLLLMGGEALRGFSLAMFIGVVFGTYSSIFIATPIVLDTLKKKKD